MNKLLQYIMDAGDVDHKFLPLLEKYQTKGFVNVANSKGKVTSYDVASSKYKKLYDNGIGRWQVYDNNSKKWVGSDASNPNAEFVSSPKTLQEVVVTAKANPYLSSAKKQALEQVGSFDDFRKSQESGYPSWYKRSSLYNPDKDLVDQQKAYDNLLRKRQYQNVLDKLPQNKGESRLDYMNRINSLAGKNFVANARNQGLTEPFAPSNFDLMKQWGWKGLNHINGAIEATNLFAPSYAIERSIQRGNQPVSGLTPEEAANVGIFQPFQSIDDVAFDYGFKPLISAGDNLMDPSGKNSRAMAQRYLGPSETDKVFTSIMNPLNYIGPAEIFAGGKNLLKGANYVGKGLDEVSRLSAPYLNRFVQQPSKLFGKSGKIKPLEGGYTSGSYVPDYMKGVETVDPETGVSKIVYDLDVEGNLPPPPKENFNLIDFNNNTSYNQPDDDFFKSPSTLKVLKHKFNKLGNTIQNKLFPENYYDYSRPLSTNSYERWARNIHRDLPDIIKPDELKKLHKEAISHFGGKNAVRKLGDRNDQHLELFIREKLADRIPSFTDPMVIDKNTGIIKNYGTQKHPSLAGADADNLMIYPDLEQKYSYDQARIDLLRSPVHKWNYDISKMTPQQIALMDSYATASTNINNHTRGFATPIKTKSGDFYAEKAKQLKDAILKNKFPEAIQVRRGETSDHPVVLLDSKTFKPTGETRLRSQLKVGDHYTNSGFLSTSIDPNYTWGSDNISEIIDIPGDMKQSYAYPNANSSSPYPSEIEAILPPGLVRRVEEIREADFATGKYPNNAKFRTSILNPYTMTLPFIGAAALKQKLKGGPIVDPRGQWAHPGEVTRIPGSSITMQGVPYPLYAKPNKGKGKVIYPGENHDFPEADYVDEYPMMQKRGITKMQSLGTVPQGTQNAMNEGAAWLQNWYKQRMQQPQFKDVAEKRYNALAQRPRTIYGDEELKRDGSEAAYDIGKNRFIIPSQETPGSTDSEIWAHEFNHYARAKAPQNFDRPFIKGYMNSFLNSQQVKKKYDMPISTFKYLRDPFETEAFLTAFRKQSNIDPSKSYSKDEMYELMKPYINSPEYEDIKKQPYDLQKQHTIKRFLQMFDNDPEKVLQLNNGIVSNNKRGTVPMAKKGGTMLPSYQTRGSVMSTADSVRHQADKILRYEQLRGGPGGAPLQGYSDPKYMSMLMDNIYPEVKKILPNASAMESAEAMDFIFNAGWDKSASKITKDPRAYALQEYYKQYAPSKLDADGKWSGRKNPAYSFDQEYNTTIGKLPENDRRILMNRGRDWYYRNINNPAPGVPNDDYYNTWYGRIWNTNDFQPFNPYNPNFTPKKEQGGEMIRRADGSYSQRGLWDNIRANKGSGKKPSKEMIEQERKIKAKNK